MAVENLVSGALTKPAFAPAGAAATPLTVFTHEFRVCSAKMEVAGYAMPW
jgi:hypothetical protein